MKLGFVIVVLIIWIWSRGGVDYLVSGPRTLVYYTNPRCGYCVDFDPIWEQLKNSGNGFGQRINFKKINCAESKTLCQIARSRGMQGTPFIALMQGGRVKPFNGDRNLPSLLKFIESDI